MKRICLPLFLTFWFAGIQLLGQNIYSYTPEGKTWYQISGEKILVKFKEDTESAQQSAVLAQEALLESITEKDILSAQKVTLPRLKTTASDSTILELVNRLRRNPAVEYANPFLVYQDGALQGIQDEFIVGLKKTGDLAKLKRIATEFNCKIVRRNEFDSTAYHLAVTPASGVNALEMANRVFETGIFAYAEPDFLLLLEPFNTNDPYLFLQWALRNDGTDDQWGGKPGADMGVFEAWDITKGSPNIKVAIIDEGVDLDHPDLAANMLPGYDATGMGSGGNPSGDDAHGTACAGIVAAAGNNWLGVAGVAYQSKIIPVRIAYRTTGPWISSPTWQANGINWARNAGADVLSNSWGGGSPSSLVNNAIHAAVTSGRGGKGAPVLFATGNNDTNVAWPASNNETIAVGATDMCDQRKTPFSCDGEYMWGSNYGTNLDITAPGVKIATTDIAGANGFTWVDYVSDFNGTSSACPNAAGVMALILSVNPDLSLSQARYFLESTCDKTGGYFYYNNPNQPNGTWSSDLGYGRVNAWEAVKLAEATLCVPPTNISISNITSFSARINFAPKSGAQSYKLQYRKAGTGTWQSKTVAGTASSYNLNGLQSCTDYEVRMQSICAAGASSWSATKPFSTTGCQSCPLPGNFTFSNITSSSARVNFSPVSGVEYYTVEYRKIGDDNWMGITASGVVFFYDLNGLNACADYEVRMRSVCLTGVSNWTSTKTFKTAGCQPCNPPASVSVSMITGNSARVSFTSSPGAQISTLEYRKINTNLWQGITASGPVNFYDLIGLEACTDYEVRIQTICGNDASDWSAIKTFKTVDCQPCTPPTDIWTSNITNNSMRVNFTPLSNALHYTLEYRKASGGIWIGLSVSGGQSYFNLSGLQACTDYEVRIQSGCSNGNSAWSAIKTFTTNGCQPCTPPSNIQANNITGNSARIDFNTVASAQNYSLRYRKVGESSWIFVSNISSSFYYLEGLQACTDYELQMQSECSGGTSTYSIPVTFKTTGCSIPCAPPENISVDSLPGLTHVKVLFTPASGAVDHVIRYRKVGDVDWKIIASTIPQGYYFLTGLQKCTDFELQLQSECASGAGAFSPSVFFKSGGCIVSSGEVSAEFMPIELYPNPASEIVNISIPETVEIPANIYLYDVTGKLLKTIAIGSNSDLISINVKNIESGTCFIRIVGKNINHASTVIINH